MTVGREEELELLRDAWRQASTQGPGIAVIRGEAGIGKSRLVEELGRMVVAEGGIVLPGGCAPYVGEAVSFAPFRDALRPLFEDRATLGMTVAASSALREMWGPSAPGSDGPPPSAEVGQARLFEAVRSALIGATANQPVLFVLEDVHWADRSSLALLAFLDRAFDRHRGSGLLLVVTCRDDPPQAVAGVIGELQRRRALIMSVPPLNDGAVRLMLEQLPGHPRDESWAAEVVERADGNPFLVEELTAAANGDPVAAREVLALRLAGLSPATLRTLRTMAVLGRQVPHDLVTAVAAVPEPALLAGLREAVEAGVLLAQAPDAYRFRHALLQEHLHGQLLPAERRLLHRRAGDALGAGAAIGRAGETAYHYDNADSGPESVHWGVRAAEEAEQLHALPEALNHYRRVLQVWPSVPDADGRAGRPRIDILRRAASLADILGHRQVAADLLAEASALLGQDASDETLAVLLADQAWAQSAVSPAAAAGLLAQAVGLLAAESSSPEAAFVLAMSPSALLMLGRCDDAAPLVSRAVTTARACGSRVALGIALSRQGLLEMQQTRLASASVTFRAALELQWETKDLLRVANTLCDYTECLHRLGQLEETIDVCLAGVARLGELGLASHFENGVILGNAAYSALKLGRTAQAAELYTTAGSYLVGDLGLVSAPIYLSRGELSQAEGLLTGGEDFGPSVEYARFYLENRAELQLLQGREREAAATALRGLAVVAGTPEEPCAGRLLLLGMRALADQSCRLRAAGRADELADVTAAVAELTASGLSLASGPIGEAAAEEVVTTAAVRAQWAAECSRLGGGSDEALWELAAAEWQRLGRPHPAAYCELRRAEALARRRAPRALLAEVLRTSFRMASGLQAQPLIDEARSLAARARIPLTDGKPSDTTSQAEELRSYGLTEREMEVLALLERGMTNQQIAQTLFISKGTTSIHLSHIFTKLGVNSRTQAALLARAARPT